MEPRFHAGIYLGRRFETNELLLGLRNGTVVKARDARETTDDTAWDRAFLEAITGVPWDPAGTMQMQNPDEESRSLPLPSVPATTIDEPIPRGMIL